MVSGIHMESRVLQIPKGTGYERKYPVRVTLSVTKSSIFQQIQTLKLMSVLNIKPQAIAL